MSSEELPVLQLKEPEKPKKDITVDLQNFKKIFDTRLIDRPVFIFCSVRSGSTLLSSILNAHSEICSPLETHFSRCSTQIKGSESAKKSIQELGLDKKHTQQLLWDAILWRIHKGSGKKLLVEKTPRNVIKWEQIVECWPKAKIIFLLRHPVSIARSWREAKPNLSDQKLYECILKYMNPIEDARKKIKNENITIRYEDITTNPEAVISEICDFLGVGYEPGMLNYGDNIDTRNRYKRGISDWSDKIKSGKIQKGRELPKDDEIPKELEDICKAWGYIR